MKRQASRSRPLYWQVVDTLQADVERGVVSPGERLPSERSLCERFGVSQITVRRSLRELAHLGIVYSRHGVGWFVQEDVPLADDDPASLSSVSDVTVVVPALDAVTGPVLQHLIGVLGADGVPVHLRFTEGDPGAEQAALSRWQRAAARKDGLRHVLLLAPCADAQDELDALEGHARRMEQPVALLVQQVPRTSLPAVVLDRTACLQKVTDHLLRLGHRRIGYIGEDQTRADSRQSYWGFATSLWEEGLELPLDWVFSSPLWDDVGRRRRSEQGERLAQTLARPYRPTALVCSSDVYSAQALSLAGEMGLHCPEDLALVGVGDHEMGPYLSPPLTTLRPDVTGLARAATQLALDLLSGRRGETVAISGEIVVRATCGAGRDLRGHEVRSREPRGNEARPR